MPAVAFTDAVRRLASRIATRTEADAQGDIYALLTSGELALGAGDVVSLEAQVGDGTRRRLDVQVGQCAIEVKKDLRPPGLRRDAEEQLAGYVATRGNQLGVRYVGVLTDGTDWYLYHLRDAVLAQAAHLQLDEKAPDAERLLVWLESILATQEQVRPTPIEIEQRLGANSPAHLLDHASLMALYEAAASAPEVALKRDLWAKLLRTALGTAFTGDEDLFIDHTLLVLTAEIIAHAVVGFDVAPGGPLTVTALARGTEFANAQIYGVVEADFFDWVVEVPGGAQYVADLARRIARFDWSHVEHDVLKVLYESVISAPTRASLGEYYTPDWLAQQMVAATITAPLTSRVLDPACGSGTFLFHAARSYLAAAAETGVTDGAAVRGLTEHVFGMDVHPVAATLARVTYLLAMGRARLAADDRGPIAVPVYLGDAVQWEQRRDLLSAHDTVTVTTAGTDLVDGGGALFGDDLIFPRSVLHDAGSFDQLVSAMADKAQDVSPKRSRELIRPTLHQFGVHPHDEEVLTATFDTMRRLHASGRNHIWGYYVRNLIRPLWLAEPDHRADILIGNPPWLRYSKMTAPMQVRNKTLGRERGLLSGPLGSSGRDLSTLFVARAVELYLKPGGSFSFVMPHGVLTRRPHQGFRSGKWSSDAAGQLTVAFTDSWDLADVTTGFPMVSCVVHGTASPAAPLPITTSKWSGRLRNPNLDWSVARDRITITAGSVSVIGGVGQPATSVYKKRFRQGAVLAPRALLFVTQDTTGPLGAGAGRVRVISRRTTLEKKPWSGVPSLHGIVERRFLRGVHLGETVAPFRTLTPLQAVLPVTDTAILTASQVDEHPALAAWWADAERTWAAHKVAGDDSALLDRIDYHGQLTAQLPTARYRVLYTKAGNRLTATWTLDQTALVDHKLYWAAVSSADEARFLTAILNSATVLGRVKPLQALGLFGGRDFDKTVFSVPIPVYDRDNPQHQALADLTGEAERLAQGVPLSPGWTFQRARREISDVLDRAGVSGRLEVAVDVVVPHVTA